MINLLEKLVESDFEDQFKPISFGELKKRVQEMDEEELQELLYDHLASLKPEELMDTYDDVAQVQGIASQIMEWIVDALETRGDEGIRDFLLELIHEGRLRTI